MGTGNADFAGIRALLSRAPGYAVAQKCLEVQAAAEASDPTLRRPDGVTLHPDAVSWFVGALGEMYVGELLAALGPGWFVRHAVPIGAGTKDVDHLVIGPPGVFAINTKHHRGANVWVGDYVLQVNGHSKHYLSAAARDAGDASRHLSAAANGRVAVWSVLAMVGISSLRDGRPMHTRSTNVLPAHDLVGWLQSLPATLSPTELQLITMAAEEPSTWHIDPHAAETLRVMQRFERLRQQVHEVQDVAVRPDVVNSREKAPRAYAGSTRRPQRTTRNARVRSAPVTPRQSGNARRRPAKRRSQDLAKAIITLAIAGFLIAHPKEVGDFFSVILLAGTHQSVTTPSPTPTAR